MKLPPALARLDYGAFRFWLPVFLLWPLMLLLFALTCFAGVIAVALMQKSTVQRLGRFLSGVYEVICASRGTQIEVDESDRRISITLL
jgi:hypothetical protein